MKQLIILLSINETLSDLGFTPLTIFYFIISFVFAIAILYEKIKDKRENIKHRKEKNDETTDDDIDLTPEEEVIYQRVLEEIKKDKEIFPDGFPTKEKEVIIPTISIPDESESSVKEELKLLSKEEINEELRKITKEEHEKANKRMEKTLKSLIDKAKEGYPIMNELNRVIRFHEAFENEHIHFPLPTLGEIINLAMKENGMTDADLTQKLGISQNDVADYINDKAEPSLRIACQLCQILNIAPVTLFEVITTHN